MNHYSIIYFVFLASYLPPSGKQDFNPDACDFESFYFSKTGEIEMIGNGDFEMVDILVVNSVGLGMCFILKISFKNKCQKKRYKYFFHFLYHLFCYVHAFSPHIPYNRKTERKHKKKEFLPSLLYIYKTG